MITESAKSLPEPELSNVRTEIRLEEYILKVDVSFSGYCRPFCAEMGDVVTQVRLNFTSGRRHAGANQLVKGLSFKSKIKRGGGGSCAEKRGMRNERSGDSGGR